MEDKVAPDGDSATFSTDINGFKSTTLGLDTEGGAAFIATGGTTFVNVVRWTINDNGQAAFLANLSDFSEAIFAQNLLGALHKIVGPGDILEVAPSDFRDHVSQLGWPQ